MKKLTLTLDDKDLEAFQGIQNSLNHTDLEDTLVVLLRLGQAAISLTSKENPEVRMYTRNTKNNVKPEAICPHCKGSFIPVVNDQSYRETSVRLI